jgi:hypothetical protein
MASLQDQLGRAVQQKDQLKAERDLYAQKAQSVIEEVITPCYVRSDLRLTVPLDCDRS